MRISPLEAWAAERTGGDLAAWQLRRLNETLALAREKGIPHVLVLDSQGERVVEA